MPTTPVQEITIIPLPDNNQMTSNNTTISGIADNGIAKYTPNGKYEITASSYLNGHLPHNAGNDNADYWECNKQTRGSSYARDPYSTNTNTDSPYVGGDNSGTDNTFTTSIGFSGSKRTANVRGEWIQVHIPYNAYIQNYRITTPIETYSTFPKKFVLVGSNDGTTWTQLDQRNLTTANTSQMLFEINTTDKYSYFRLIINGMGPNKSTIKITEFRLVGTTMIRANPNVDTFITLTRSIEINEELKNETSYDGINMYDKQYARYDTSRIRDIEKESNENNVPKNNDDQQQRQRQNQNNQPINYLTQTSAVACLVLTSAFIYTLLS